MRHSCLSPSLPPSLLFYLLSFSPSLPPSLPPSLLPSLLPPSFLSPSSIPLPPPSLSPYLPSSFFFKDATVVKVVIQDLPDEPPSLTASQFSATLCEDAIGGEVVELVSNCLLLMYLPLT